MIKAAARLSFGDTRPLRNPEKHLLAVENWAREFEGFYPER